jgi:hypothetical protein
MGGCGRFQEKPREARLTLVALALRASESNSHAMLIWRPVDSLQADESQGFMACELHRKMIGVRCAR